MNFVLTLNIHRMLEISESHPSKTIEKAFIWLNMILQNMMFELDGVNWMSYTKYTRQQEKNKHKYE